MEIRLVEEVEEIKANRDANKKQTRSPERERRRVVIPEKKIRKITRAHEKT